DLINVTPNVLLIREALGNTDRPVFAHLPLIVNAQRKKLSKRRDDVSVEQFRLEDVVSSPAFFDPQKLDHFNGEYIRALDTAEFTQRVDEWLPAEWDR